MFITSLYILKRLCALIGFLAAILVLLLWLTQSLRFIEVIVHHNISLHGYLSLIVYLLPDMFVKVVPICTLVGAIICFGKLTLDNELQVLQALGKSPWQILRPGLSLACILTAALFLLNIYSIPNAYRAFRSQEFQLRNQFSSSIVREGAFNVIKGLTIFVEKRKSAKEFEGVFIHDIGEHAGKKNKKPYTLLAKKGILKKINNKYVLVLNNGIRQEKDNKNAIQSFEFDELIYNLDDFTKIVNSRSLKPYERDLKELFQVNSENVEDVKLRKRMEAEGHQRILLPFLCLINMFIAGLIMVVNRPSRRLRRKRMVWLILTGVLFQWAILNLLQLQIRYQFSVALAYSLVLFVLLFSFIVLKYGRFHHPLQRLLERCGI